MPEDVQPSSIASVKDALTSVDWRLIEGLRKGQIRLVSTAWLLQQPDGQAWQRCQDLEALEKSGKRPHLTPDEAAAALQAANRSVAVVSHGWLQPGQPDSQGHRLRAIRKYLQEHPTLIGLFFDYSSLPQHPRTEAETLMFKAGLNVMNYLYGSPLGTTVLQLKFIPQVAVELFNDRPYDDRGWCRFEEAMSTEAVARLAYYPALRVLLSTLPTEKIVQFDMDGTSRPVRVEADDQNGMRSRIEAVVEGIQAATFTGKGDKPTVINLYLDYCAKIGSAITDAAPGGVAEVYVGERNASGQREGHGALSTADGDAYTGQWKADKAHGVGTYTWATGSKYEGQWNMFDQDGQGTFTWANGMTYVGFWKKDRPEGRGRKTSPDGTVYDGEFSQGVMQGHGKMVYWATGSEYEGQWNMFDQDGQGTFTWANGMTYDGEFSQGFMQGHGKMVYANGDMYEGQWREAKRHGQGKMVFADGKEEDATWTDDHVALIDRLLRCCRICVGVVAQTPVPVLLRGCMPK